MKRPHLAAISRCGSRSFKGVVYRAVVRSLQERVLSTEGNRFFAGWYHVVGETGILYTSLKETTALQELLRHAARNTLSEEIVVGKINVALQKVLDLTDKSVLAKLGVSKDVLISDDKSIARAISMEARKAGFQGLIVPSATSEGTNLIIFENNFSEGCMIEIESVQP